MLGFMRPSTRLPIVELAEPAKAEVARAIAEIGDEDLACRARFGTAPAPATGSPVKIDPRESLPIAEPAP